ncbi:MAG: hypothetical protein ACE5I9_01460 [Candidatus Methylomirabilales bacterium]
MGKIRNDFSGKKIQRYRRKEPGHLPDDYSRSMQKDRALKAAIGLHLARDDKYAINHFFQKGESGARVFRYVFDFLQGRGEFIDLRLDSYREQLTPDLIRNRIRTYISDESLDRWLEASLDPASEVMFTVAIGEIHRCVGGLMLAKSLQRQQSGYRFFRRYLDADPIPEARELASVLDGSESEADVAAEMVYEFIRAILDKGQKPVWIAFLEGLSVQAGVAAVPGASLNVGWNCAPMLKALAEEGQQHLARYYEEFIRIYLRTQMRSNDPQIGDWQRRYDQHFRMFINIQSGMFSPHTDYRYGQPR